MRIVQAIESSGPGGAEQVLLGLTSLLRQEGHDVQALLLRSGWLARALEERGIGVSILPIARVVDLDFLKRLTHFLEQSETEIFHSHEFTFALYGRVATARLGVPHVATAHGRNFSAGFKRRGSGMLALRAGRSFRLVAVSESLAERLAADFLIDRTAVTVVPNGIEIGSFASAAARGDAEPLRVVAVGNLYPVKNHGLLIRAASQVLGSGIPLELEILGRGGEEGALQEMIEELGVGEHVRLRGFRSDVPEFLSRAHVFASSSLSEAMPLSFLEAMAHGLPIVASRVGGVPEIVEDGRNGLLFESQDASGAAAALLRLARDEALRRRLGENARALARGRHAADTMLRRYLGLYQKAARS